MRLLATLKRKIRGQVHTKFLIMHQNDGTTKSRITETNRAVDCYFGLVVHAVVLYHESFQCHIRLLR